MAFICKIHLTIVLAILLLPENRMTRQPKLDIPGMLLISLVLFLFIYPLIKGREAGWPAWIFVCMGAAIPALIVFINVENRTVALGKDPLIDLRLFHDKHFVTGLIIIFLFNATAAFFMIYPIYLQNGLHWNVLSTGMAVLPYAIGFFTGPFASPVMARKLGAAVVLLALGLLAIGFGIAICATMTWPPGYRVFSEQNRIL
ncbi:MFS transporter [Chitinophaga niastensis]|uniref:MFS transporter n=1 Tax=Chitinophaga niastensis TaxID=536980 RepID=A0A2P8H9G9_CHINA|nr:MFS transporter [Chitinophaga niastensis]PSL42883.1 MFS transporter [Chitinophaga niastensis]